MPRARAVKIIPMVMKKVDSRRNVAVCPVICLVGWVHSGVSFSVNISCKAAEDEPPGRRSVSAIRTYFRAIAERAAFERKPLDQDDDVVGQLEVHRLSSHTVWAGQEKARGKKANSNHTRRSHHYRPPGF